MPFQTEAAQLAADSWRKELGLDVEVRVGNSQAIRKAWGDGELKGQLIWRDNETRRDALSITVNGYGDAEGNIRRSDDPELQAQAQIAARIVDNDERAKALTEFYKVIRNEGYEIGIGYVNVPWGVGSRIANWEPYPLAPNISGLHTITLK